MKRLPSILAGLGILAASGCSNEIDVIGDWKEIPVVYGILKSQDTATYIRIEKAYLPPNTDALQVAQNPDSLYFAENELRVVMFENDRFFDTLRRVDANLEGYVRDSGIFVQSPNYAYKTRRALRPAATYRLELQSLKTNTTYAPQTIALDPTDFLITSPATSRPVRWSYRDNNGYVMADVRFAWIEPEYGAIYDLTIRFYYQEFQVDGNGVELPNTRVEKSLDWKPIQNYTPVATPAQDINGQRFYEHLASRLAPAGANLRRCAKDLDIIVDAGGEELSAYIKSNVTATTLISGLFPPTPYTNIPGGMGVFSSSYRSTKFDIRLDPEVFEYLNVGEITAGLGFVATSCQ